MIAWDSTYQLMFP